MRQSYKKQTRVQLYLPIADIPVNVFLILAMGAAVGFVSGMFGIGGGFLMTPLLIFVGIAPAVAVASVASHIAASSFSGAISYWRRRAIDPLLAAVLLTGGSIGTALGVWTFTLLRSLGQLDLMIAMSYVILLTTVGGLMFWEGLRALLRARRGGPVTTRRPGSHVWIHGLPLKMRFKRSKIYLSVIPVVVIGLVIGFIGAVMGIGGGFILVPLLIYVLRVPTSTVIGTSMVLTLVTMVFATMLHAITNHLVDAVLALILMVGGVTGAQFGARAGQKIRGEHLRLLLGLLVLAVGVRFAVELVIRPEDLFTIRETGVTRMIARVPLTLGWLAAGRSARGLARAGRAADRVGVEPPRHRDAELLRRGAGAVRLGGKGRQYAGQSHLRSGGDGGRPARRHGDPPQGAPVRDLDQHRLPAIPESAEPIWRCSPTGRSTPSPRPKCSGGSSSG